MEKFIFDQPLVRGENLLEMIRPLSKELQEKANKELNETPGRMSDGLAHIKSWLEKQPHLSVRTDDQWLVAFLRGSKYSLEIAKQKIEMLHTSKTLIPEYYGNRDPLLESVQTVLNAGYILPLPKPNSRGERIILYRTASIDPSKVREVDIVKTYSMIVDILMIEDDNTIVSGLLNLVDTTDLTMSHVGAWSLTNVKKSMKLAIYGYPMRLKGFQFNNAPSFFEIIYGLLTAALTPKLKKRVKINYDEKDIPTALLPKEYGGETDTVENLTDYWKRKVESYRDWFLDDIKYRSIEEKRVGPSKLLQEYYGVEGSFRKLEVD